MTQSGHRFLTLARGDGGIDGPARGKPSAFPSIFPGGWWGSSTVFAVHCRDRDASTSAKISL